MKEPEMIDDDTMCLWGGGPRCAGCDGPTYCVGSGGRRPWWCPDCNVRFTDDGEYGSAASFPAGTAEKTEGGSDAR
jgi:hypothetical protein